MSLYNINEILKKYIYFIILIIIDVSFSILETNMRVNGSSVKYNLFFIFIKIMILITFLNLCVKTLIDL
jgi:hypothetical protein